MCKGPRTGRVAGNWLGEETGGGRQGATVDLREGFVILSSGKLWKGLRRGWTGKLVCDSVVPLSDCGTWGSLPTSQGDLEAQQEPHLASCLAGICCWLQNVPELFSGAVKDRGHPKVC